jgi:hypothetical protein
MLKMTPAYSCAVDVKGQKMLQGDFAPHSKVSQHHKDLRIILEYSERAGQELPLATLHTRILEQLMATGAGTVVTACPFCFSTMDDAVKTAGVEGRIVVKDLTELVAESLPGGKTG